MQRHRHQEFIRFLNVIEARVSKKKTIHIIVDNYAQVWANFRSRSRLCENALGQRMRRIVFSIAFFLKKLAVQSTPISTKIEMEVLHASWTSEFSHSLDPKRTLNAASKSSA